MIGPALWPHTSKVVDSMVPQDVCPRRPWRPGQSASRRGQIAIVDKVGVVALDGHVGFDMSADTVLAQAGEGRRRLGTWRPSPDA